MFHKRSAYGTCSGDNTILHPFTDSEEDAQACNEEHSGEVVASHRSGAVQADGADVARSSFLSRKTLLAVRRSA